MLTSSYFRVTTHIFLFIHFMIFQIIHNEDLHFKYISINSSMCGEDVKNTQGLPIFLF